MPSKPKRLAIVQYYVPRYRHVFYDQLVAKLADAAIECKVIVSRPSENYSMRGDAVEAADWLETVPPPHELWSWRSGPKFFGYGTDRFWRGYDGIVMDLRGTSIDLNLEVLKKRRTGRKIGVWAHLSRFVKPPSALDLAVERWQMRNSDHIFAYTQQGADSAVEIGIPVEKVTAVMNSVDVNAFVRIHNNLNPTDVESFMQSHSLVPGKTFGFIGGVDYWKRTQFIAETLDFIWKIDRDVKLIVAGQGDEVDLLGPAVQRGQVVMLGYCGPADKAMVCRASQALICPGRIGLVAIDSLAVGIPILTTDWGYHAPEYDYLTPDEDVFVSANSANDFGQLTLSFVDISGAFRPRAARNYPKIQDMVGNFASGVLRMFGQ